MSTENKTKIIRKKCLNYPSLLSAVLAIIREICSKEIELYCHEHKIKQILDVAGNQVFHEYIHRWLNRCRKHCILPNSGTSRPASTHYSQHRTPHSSINILQENKRTHDKNTATPLMTKQGNQYSCPPKTLETKIKKEK